MTVMASNYTVSGQIAYREWMRRVSCFVYFAVYWAFFNGLFFEAVPHPMPPLPSLLDLSNFGDDFGPWMQWLWQTVCQHLGFYQLSPAVIERYGFGPTLWLVTIRLLSLLHVYIAYVAISAFLQSSLPDPYLDENGNSLVCAGGTLQANGLVSRLEPVHCVCIRIVTRGDKGAQPLVRKAVSTAISLLNEMCRCEHLKVHVVTQTHFLDAATKEIWLRSGATEVRQLFVPSTYTSANGSLYKARNICYWEDVGGVGSECDETRSWVLSLDEEAVITRPLLASFINDVLRNDPESTIGYALGPFSIEVHSCPTTFMTKILEARQLAYYYSWLKHRISSDQGITMFHGAAYFVRASVDRQVGNDWGPQVSVAEDFATGLVANQKRIRFKYLDGWLLEGTAPTVRGWIVRSARWLRGHIYTMVYIRMGKVEKLQYACCLTILHAIPFVQLFMVTVLILNLSAFTPTGPRCALLDLIFIFTLLMQSLTYVFGASYIQMEKSEVIGCLLISPFMVLVFQPLIEVGVTCWALVCVYKDWKRGIVSFEVTEKSGGKTQ